MALELNRKRKKISRHDRKCLDCLKRLLLSVNTEGTDGEHSERKWRASQWQEKKAMNAVSGNGHRHKPIFGRNIDD